MVLLKIAVLKHYVQRTNEKEGKVRGGKGMGEDGRGG